MRKAPSPYRQQLELAFNAHALRCDNDAPHVFADVPEGAPVPAATWQCGRCGKRLEYRQALWYYIGLAHSGSTSAVPTAWLERVIAAFNP